MPSYFFVRVNGDTAHNNPDEPALYVKGEPPPYPKTFITYVKYCLENNVIRIGWPGSGDLSKVDVGKKMSQVYGMQPKRATLVSGYLEGFRDMPKGSIVLMPDKERPGLLYIGVVTSPYEYFFDVKAGHWYECANRRGVRWDLDPNGALRKYQAAHCGLPIVGGFWRRAFAQIDALAKGAYYVREIEKSRQGMK